MADTDILPPLHATTLRLDDIQRAQVAAVARELVETTREPLDSAKWLDAARAASTRLPGELLTALRSFRHDPGPDALLLIGNLPVGPALPSTPTEADSVERTPTTSAAVITLSMLQLGEVIAYRNEKGGALVQNVVPVPGRERQQSNAGSVRLEMHSENAFHPGRPDYVGLLGVREDPSGAARLCTASIRRALPLLARATRRVLSEERFMTEPPPSFGGLGTVTPNHALLTGAAEDPDLVVDFAATHPLDEQAAAAMTELSEALSRTTVAHPLQAGDLAVVDNRLAVHGRTPFTPRYDGSDRWLHRVYACLDYRRSRPAREADGAVLR
ncbi:TauD/TfdA family dioxygenase [Streptomyces hygroscopicus]|uniref:TauD/TfdA family dioxygenase n=1 Tax=Streptomyces hygroscopicus TaxID=1912 RepID=UPI00082C805D|nr:TauD/TfdA family dioxygenase [Streptomyces hygroscopicus]GLV75852.1 L-asparagine oxygenase [Streptomyces hygroscopicus subsp. hygroscopicus]